MPRPPKPQKAIEYTLDVHTRTDTETGALFTRFEIRTTREFQNFQYRLNVDAAFDAATQTVNLHIGGVSIPADLMPGEGPAVGGFELPALKPGEYSIVVTKPPKDVNTFSLTVTRSRLNVVAGEIVGRTFIHV